MALVGVNHIATVTEDLDRLIEFYERIFESRVVLDVEIPQIKARHAFITIGGPSILHAWEVEDADTSRFGGEMFDRGRIDHVALQADGYASFETLRRRLLSEGATEGVVNNFGPMESFSFRDPDGLWCEVCWYKDGTDPSKMDMTLFVDPIADAL
jgi:catechol 2,3-dioxygenase-like lactoylglutathione lyase family enzyme